MREIKISKNKELIEAASGTDTDKNLTLAVTITVRLSLVLLEKLKKIVASSRCGSNYIYPNTSTIIRNALEAYKDGMAITALVSDKQKKETSLKISKELKAFYDSLPAKSEMLERAINTYLKDKI